MRSTLFFVAFCLSSGPLGIAQNVAVRGVVRNADVAIANARVEFVAGDKLLASANTNSTGRYDALLPTGKYSVRVTPPSTLSLQAETLSDVSVASPESVLDVFLLNLGREIGGIVRGLGGKPIQNVNVEIRSKSNRIVGQARTGPDGRYSTVVRGIVSVGFRGGGSPDAPSSWTATRDNVAESVRTLDVDLPVIAVSGVVRGVDGQPFAASVNIQSSDSLKDMEVSGGGTNNTGADGRYSLLTLAGNAAINVFPLDAKQTAFTQLAFNLDKDATRDVQAPTSAAIRGTVRGFEGKPLASVNVSAYSKIGDRLVGQTKTELDGRYSISVNGPVDLRFTGSSSPFAPSAWSLRRRDIDPSTSFRIDVDLPIVKLSGTVKGNDGSPIPNVSITAITRGADKANNVESDSTLEVKSAPDGTYNGFVLKGSMTTNAYAPAALGLTPQSNSVAELNDDRVQEFVLSSGSTITGTVYGFGNHPVAGATVYLMSTANRQVFSQTRTNTDGQYTVRADGLVSLRFNGATTMDKPSLYTPLSWDFFIHGVDASKTPRLDAVLPVVEVRGTVTDSEGQALRGGYVSAIVTGVADQSRLPALFSASAAQAKEGGTFSILIFKGSGEFTTEVPVERLYPRVVVGEEFQSDANRYIRLQRVREPK